MKKPLSDSGLTVDQAHERLANARRNYKSKLSMYIQAQENLALADRAFEDIKRIHEQKVRETR